MTKTKLGFWSIVLLAINSIIGSGIFLTPGSVVSMVGTKAPLAYFFAAIFASILAITFAAAAKYVNKTGRPILMQRLHMVKIWAFTWEWCDSSQHLLRGE